MSFIWNDKKGEHKPSPEEPRKPWSPPQIVRLRPGSAELERARKALLGDEDT